MTARLLPLDGGGICGAATTPFWSQVAPGSEWGGLQRMTENHIMGAAGDEKIVACQDRRIMDQGTDIRVNTRLKGQAGLPPCQMTP